MLSAAKAQFHDALTLWRAAAENGHPNIQAQLLRFDILDAFALTPAYCLCAFFAFRAMQTRRRLAWLLPLATFVTDELENAVTYLFVVKLNSQPLGLLLMQTLTLVKWIGIVGIIITLGYVILQATVHWVVAQVRGG